MNLSSNKGVTALETVLAVAILSWVGLVISEVFTRTYRMADNNLQASKAFALGEMALEQYNAYAALSAERLPSFDKTRAKPREFFGTNDDFGYDRLRLTTRADPIPEESLTQVTIRISWGSGLFAPVLTFTKIYPHWMSGESSDLHARGI